MLRALATLWGFCLVLAGTGLGAEEAAKPVAPTAPGASPAALPAGAAAAAPEPEDPVEAASEAVNSQNDAYIQRLVEALAKDDSYKVRLQAAVFLGRSADDRSVDPLIKNMASDEHYTVRAACATALANLDELRAISHIIRAAALDPDQFVREEAGRALRKFDRQEALPYASHTYGSEDQRVRQLVVEYLAEGPFEAAETVLTRALGDVQPIHEVAKAAVLKRPPAEVLRFLTAAVEHRDAGVRRGAVLVLHALGTKEATDVIMKVYERDVEVDQVRAATRDALRDLHQFFPLADIIQSALSDADKHSRARAIKFLGVVGGAEARDALLKILGDEEIYLRGTAVMALRDLGSAEAIEPLEKLLQDPINQRIALQIRAAVKQLKKQHEPQSH